MGIDIYLKWTGQTEEEKDAQITGFDITAGRVGYLREAYHGEPYATRILVPEAFEEIAMYVEGYEYQATTLRERLAETLAAVEERYRGSEIVEPAKQSYIDFVELAEKKEAEGKRIYVYASY